MKFLIVDDDVYKISRVAEYLKGHEIIAMKAYNPAMRFLISEKVDGVVLDMGFPIFEDGHGLESDQGLKVLSELQRLEIPVPVLVYSGNFYDTRRYSNVFDYVLVDNCDLEKRIKQFIKHCGLNER